MDFFRGKTVLNVFSGLKKKVHVDVLIRKKNKKISFENSVKSYFEH